MGSQRSSQKATYPKGIPYIIGNEIAERFSFYGMRSILAIFLVSQFFNPTQNTALNASAEAKANAYTHFFTFLVYLFPLIGGALADWFLGKYKVILYVSIIYLAGHCLLALFDTNLHGFTLGLMFIAVGAGGIKSSTSANLGDQFNSSNAHLMSKAYGWFYFSINVGGLLGPVVIPLIRDYYGAKWAFGVPGIFMSFALVIFLMGRKHYIKVLPRGVNKNNFLFISLYALSKIRKKQKGQPILDLAKKKFDPQKVDDMKAVWKIIGIFSFIPIYFSLWDQCLSEWVLQATKLDLKVFSIALLPEQIQTANAIFLLMLIPTFTYGVYPLLESFKIKFTHLRRIGTGFILIIVSFIIIALLQVNIEQGEHPSIWWQILAYFILSASEVLVVVTGTEYAYAQSPKSMKSTMAAIFLLTMSVGNLFTAAINASILQNGFFAFLKGAYYFWFFVIIMSICASLFLAALRYIEDHKYIATSSLK